MFSVLFEVNARSDQWDAYLGPPREDVRLRRVRVVRDYGMFDRRESPQYYPEAAPVR